MIKYGLYDVAKKEKDMNIFKVMRKKLLFLLFFLSCGSMLFAQEPLKIEDVEQIPLGDLTYQWRGVYDRVPLHGKCRIILSYRSYAIANFNKEGILDGPYEEYEDNYLSKKMTYVKGRLRGKGYEYYYDGSVAKEYFWNNQGKLDGLMVDYSRAGRMERDYKNGKIDGQERIFDKDGKLVTFISYSNDMRYGPFRIYEEGGTDMPSFVREGYTWGWSGKKGEYKETWAQSGKLKCIEYYTEKGEKTGLWKEWDFSGKLIREENYAEIPYYSVKFDEDGYPVERRYYNEDLSTKIFQEFYPGTDKVMKEEYNIDFEHFKRDYRLFYDDGIIQEEGCMKSGKVIFAKEYYKNKQLKCVKKMQNIHGYELLTVTELYDEAGKPLPLPSGLF